MSDSSDDERPLAARTKPSAANTNAVGGNAHTAKAVKKEPTTTATKKGAAASNGAVKKENAKPVTVKKEVVVKKEAANGAASKGKQKPAIAVKDEKVKREKKEFDLPGQTRETPPETDPLRKFYTSLLQQRPDSQISRKWCVQHGLLSKSEAMKWLEQAGKASLKSPVKSQPPAKRSADSKPSAAPVKKPKVEAGKATKGNPPAKSKAPAKPVKKPAAGKDKAFDDDSDDDDVPLGQRARKL